MTMGLLEASKLNLQMHVFQKAESFGETEATMPLSSDQKHIRSQSSTIPGGVGRFTKTNVDTKNHPIAKVSMPRIKTIQLFTFGLFMLFDPARKYEVAADPCTSLFSQFCIIRCCLCSHHTWLFVMMMPSGSITKPEPSD